MIKKSWQSLICGHSYKLYHLCINETSMPYPKLVESDYRVLFGLMVCLHIMICMWRNVSLFVFNMCRIFNECWIWHLCSPTIYIKYFGRYLVKYLVYSVNIAFLWLIRNYLPFTMFFNLTCLLSFLRRWVIGSMSCPPLSTSTSRWCSINMYDDLSVSAME